MRRVLVFVLGLLAVLVPGRRGLRCLENPERATLDAEARAGAPGKFITLSRGITHYEMAGPDSARVVVLVHGFSVPSYIWDSTFAGLTGGGHRVLRYDLYGRGFSDRPGEI
jgi:pimeloyl-ACP methyl ester carboxylesterase